MLTPTQINELLTIISRNQSIFIAKKFGPEFLSTWDRHILTSFNIDYKTLYSPESDSILTLFHLGMLAKSLRDTKALQHFNYKLLTDYIKQGKYIPITQREQATIDMLKNQTLADIRSTNGKIFQDINNVVGNARTQQEFIKEKLIEGTEKKSSLREISNELHRLTGDWTRNFDRIVEYQCNTAYQEGRAAFLEKTEGNDVLVYKRVFESACEHCVEAYLTNGIGSEPRIFKLSILRSNGSNIGRKVKDWKPVIHSHHPFCRCLLSKYPQGFKWDKEKQDFTIRDESKPILKKPRSGIRITVAGKEYTV